MHGGISHVFAAIAWTLIHSLWQGALVAASYYLFRRFTTAASVRYFIGHCCLALFVVGQAVTFAIASTSPLALLEWVAGDIRPQPLGSGGQSLLRTLPAIPLGNFIATVEPLLPWVGILWLSCAAARLAWFSALLIHLQYELNRCVAVAAPAAARLQKLAARIRVKARFLECDAISVPGTVGWLRPIVLVPAGWITGTSPQDVEAIILHELAHIARRDFLGSLLRILVRALYYFHLPLILLSRQLDEDAEQATDALAASTHGDFEAYGAALLRLEIDRPSLALALGAGGGTLAMRLRHLVETKRGARHSVGRMATAVIGSGLSLLSVGYAATAMASNRAELEWLTARDLTTSVLETLATPRPNPSAELLVSRLHVEPRPSPDSLIALARSLRVGFDPTLFNREAEHAPESVPFGQAELPTFGTYAQRERLVKALCDCMRQSPTADRADLARAAIVLSSLDLIDSNGVLASKLILNRELLNELQIDAVSKRRLEYAAAMHNRRIGQLLKLTTPVSRQGELSENDLVIVIDLLQHVPGVKRHLLRSPNTDLRRQLGITLGAEEKAIARSTDQR
jgi:beta-lactamase regulating signal transducer with metallopeptidase domain